MPGPLLSLVAWRRQLASIPTDATIYFLQCFRRAHGSPAVLEVSAEATSAAARRSIPLVRVPESLELEFEGVLAEYDLKPRDARRLGMELSERLQSLSHTPQRGGFGPPSTRTSSLLGGRLRGAELLAAREAFEAGELLSMDDRAVNAALGLPPPLRDDQRHALQMEKLAPKYKTEAEVLAYVVARLAPEYAVCRRVLEEAMRLLGAAEVLPGDAAAKWRPREALVYGAGVGAAVISFLESCTSPSLTRVVAVEPSPLRQMLGTRVEKAHRAKQLQFMRETESLTQQHDNSVLGNNFQHHDRQVNNKQAVGRQVSWVQSLPPLTKAAAAQRRRYDVVIAPYQLTVLPTAEERHRLVRELWDRCGDVLVLIEPGTPRGFAAIAEARELVLGREGRKRIRLEAAAAASAQGSGGRLDPRIETKLRGSGAYVVAPCPHDGTCPMLASKRNWCHFSQPLLLPAFMQQAMVMPGNKAHGRGRALNVQDERFSYVILRRGARPMFRTAVSRLYDVEGDDGDNVSERGAAALMVPSKLPPRVVLGQVMLNRDRAASGGKAPTDLRTPLGEAFTPVSGQGRDNVPPISHAGDVSEPRTALRRTPLFASLRIPGNDLTDLHKETTVSETVANAAMRSYGMPAPSRQVPTSVLSGPCPGGSVADHVGTRDAGDENMRPMDLETASAADAVKRSPVVTAFSRKYPAFGSGLVGRLMALQDAGVDWAGTSNGEVEDRSLVASEHALHSPGLDTVVAAHTMSTLNGLHALSADGLDVSDVDTGSTGASVRSMSAVEAVNASTVREATWVTVQHSANEDVVVPGLDELGTSEVQQQEEQQRPLLTLDDVTKDEYDAAERQLMERIYGTAAAQEWEVHRRNNGGMHHGNSDAVDEIEDMSSAREENIQQQHRDSEETVDDDDADEHHEGLLETEATDLEHQAENASPGALRVAEASSYSWGRLVRSPRLRGGHVILDMCVGPQHHYPESPNATGAAVLSPSGQGTLPASPDAGAADEAAHVLKCDIDTSALEDADAIMDSEAASPCNSNRDTTRPEGRLIQQVVAKSARRGWMGAPAYRLARRLSWGDCWPDWYIRKHNTREVAPEVAPGATSEDVPRLGGRK